MLLLWIRSLSLYTKLLFHVPFALWFQRRIQWAYLNGFYSCTFRFPFQKPVAACIARNPALVDNDNGSDSHCPSVSFGPFDVTPDTRNIELLLSHILKSFRISNLASTDKVAYLIITSPHETFLITLRFRPRCSPYKERGRKTTDLRQTERKPLHSRRRLVNSTKAKRGDSFEGMFVFLHCLFP